MFDVLIKGGRVADGTGSPAVIQDIGICGDSITAIGGLEAHDAGELVAAQGHLVCPGFIDIHAHSDFNLLLQPPGRSKICQGVTTEVCGNCGLSGAPLAGAALEQRRKSLTGLGVDISWSTAREYFATLERQQLFCNVVPLIGHGNVRGSVLGYANRTPAREELEKMQELVRESMDAGAWGLSSGLFYPPGVYAAAEELICLAAIAAECGGIYASHIRNEEDMVIDAVDEALRIGREARIPVQISHLKTMGEKNWHKLPAILEKIEKAIDDGIPVSADRYPYTAASTDLDALLPAWACEGGIDAELERLREARERSKIFTYILAGREPEEVFSKVLISRVFTEHNKPLEGKSVAAAADMLYKSIRETFFDLLIEEKLRVGAIFISMSEENLQHIYQQDYVMIGSDSAVWDIEGALGEGKPHPRAFGTFPRVLRKYVFEQKVLTLEQAIKKMTWQAAEKIGLQDRGQMAAGYKADLVMLKVEEISDQATYENPHQFPSGISRVMVNGRWVVKDGIITGNYPGKVILKN